ncbi:sodium bicarbonate cotransporter 3 isoform X4 [Paroedura picta]|uniref:sodium bicarbonate cotransporter 3 isoform X4 n=1 Tax=Paroedura picta TaxID=143630 RepID=UPI0040562088
MGEPAREGPAARGGFPVTRAASDSLPGREGRPPLSALAQREEEPASRPDRPRPLPIGSRGGAAKHPPVSLGAKKKQKREEGEERKSSRAGRQADGRSCGVAVVVVCASPASSFLFFPPLPTPPSPASHSDPFLSALSAPRRAMEEERAGEQMRPLLTTGHDEEAVVDTGKISSTINTNFEKEELESHRAVYIGVHVPFGKQGRRRHRHRGHKHHRRRKEKETDREDGRESPSYDTPSQRVHFILGTEDDDEEHIPHDLFTEMDELCFREGEEYEWKETARWLKFEEDVEDGGDRWSKPYVATLSLHSLFELRSCILNGTVMLDMRANTLDEIADMVLDNMIASGHLDESTRESVREALLKRHHHQNEKKLSNRIPLVRSFADIGKKHSDPLLLERNGLLASPQSAPGNLDTGKSGEIKSSGTGGSRENSTVDFSKESASWHCSCGTLGVGLKRPAVDMNFMRKIPMGAEASNVLVGEVDFLERPIIAFVRLSPAVLLTGLTEVPVPTRFLFILLGPAGKAPQYHEIGRSIATLMTDDVFHDVAYKAKDRNDLLSGIDEFLDQVTVLPPGEWDPSIRIEPPKSVPSQEKRKIPKFPNGAVIPGEPLKEEGHHAGPELQRTGRLFGGLILDIKRKAPFFLSDFKDALSLQCLASILFLYCACMSPVITFGGLLGEATEGRISAIESLFGASLTGIAYSLFAGQPLTILGSTGPVLVFEKILYKFCKDYKLSYLSLRTSIGLWTSFLCILLVATDASSLVCYITRFTEEAFAALICIIFIYEALEKLFQLGGAYAFNMHNDLDRLTLYSCACSEPSNPSNETLELWMKHNKSADTISWANLTVTECKTYQGVFHGLACGRHGPYFPDVLFWCVILFFTTFFLSSFLKQFKTKRYFPTKVRSTISDFAVFLTIVIMVLIDYLVGVPSPKLHVPEKFEPTRSDRGWLIDPLGPNPWWTLIVAAVPALLCTILIFMDQQITAVIINRKEHKLKKGCGYHLDLLMVGVMLGICSIMGLPWFVAATVLSISHVNSLKVESECSAPGEQPKFLGIREQRVTGLMIFVLMGMSVFMTSILKFIPMPVLYGVFLYMGASSLRGIQFFDRIKLFGMPAKHQPDLIYLRYVPLWKVHIFTVVQLTCLVLLWAIKASKAAVVFPMMVLALVFIRKLMDLCFTKRELSWLDDLMPESKKKKEDDKKKKAKEEAERMFQTVDSETVHLPYERSDVLEIPVKALKYSIDPSVVNISDEMAKTAQWKALSMNTENSKVTRSNLSSEKEECVKIDMEKASETKYVDAETSV